MLHMYCASLVVGKICHQLTWLFGMMIVCVGKGQVGVVMSERFLICDERVTACVLIAPVRRRLGVGRRRMT